MNFSAIRERITLDVVRWAPKGLFSAAVGWGARLPLPHRFRSPLYRAFASWSGARLDEVELPLDQYPSLAHFFARRLQPDARRVESDPRAIISPCDGAIAAVGAAGDGRMIQAKGKEYSLAELVGDRSMAATLTGGPYVTIYLSPRDYHRVHAPIATKLLGYHYIPGSFFPVNPLFSREVDDLMALNERVVFDLQTDVGAAALVMVAALGVSNIEVAHDRIETRYLRSERVAQTIRFDEPIDIRRGEELGAFNLGSTTILIFEPGSAELGDLLVGDTVRFGQALGHTGSHAGGVGPVSIIS